MGSINSGEKKGLNVITKDFMNKTQTKLRTKLSCVYKYNMYKVTVRDLHNSFNYCSLAGINSYCQLLMCNLLLWILVKSPCSM